MAISRRLALASLCLLLAALAAPRPSAAAARDVVNAVVGVRTEVPAEARTAGTLGRERLGSGIVIDASGLVLTIGYVILEAAAVDLYDAQGERVPAEVVGYDHATGFGLVRATLPLEAKPVTLGDSAAVAVGDPLLVVSRVGGLGGREAKLVDRREFAGYWEYLLPDALFTTPPHEHFAGAALLDTEGRLIGVGSLYVGDAAAADLPSPGNMFVPVNALKPILGDLLAFGKRNEPGHPWIGVSLIEHGNVIIVRGVSDGGPAEAAGVQPGDVVLGVGNTPTRTLAEFYKQIWALGEPGVRVPLRVLRDSRLIDVDVGSIDRMRWLRLKQSY